MENYENNEVLNEEVEQESNEIEPASTAIEETSVQTVVDDEPETKSTSPALAIGVGILVAAGVTTLVVKGVKKITTVIKNKKAKKAAEMKASAPVSDDTIIDVEEDEMESCEN